MGEPAAPLLARALARAVGAKAPRPAKAQNGPHRPSACRDRSCQRPLCTAYREGREDGYDEGFGDGFAAGAASAKGN